MSGADLAGDELAVGGDAAPGLACIRIDRAGVRQHAAGQGAARRFDRITERSEIAFIRDAAHQGADLEAERRGAEIGFPRPAFDPGRHCEPAD